MLTIPKVTDVTETAAQVKFQAPVSHACRIRTLHKIFLAIVKDGQEK